MGAPRPIALREANAAKLLDMPATKFRSLVSLGALPPPVRIGDEERWLVAHIEAILSGRAAIPDDEDIA